MPATSVRPVERHAELGGAFFDRVELAHFPELILRHRNHVWAARVGLDGLTDAEWVTYRLIRSLGAACCHAAWIRRALSRSSFARP